MRLCWQFALRVNPTFRAGPTGEPLLPRTKLLPPHCTERGATLQAQGKGFILTRVLGVTESGWHCLRWLDRRVAVWVRIFCPKVECHLKAALPSCHSSLWWALLLRLDGREGCSPAIAGLSSGNSYTADCTCWCQDPSAFLCCFDTERATKGLPGWNSWCNADLHSLWDSVPIRTDTHTDVGVFLFIIAIASFLKCRLASFPVKACLAHQSKVCLVSSFRAIAIFQVQLTTFPFPEAQCVGVGEKIKDIQTCKGYTGQLKVHQVHFSSLCALNLVLPLALM